MQKSGEPVSAEEWGLSAAAAPAAEIGSTPLQLPASVFKSASTNWAMAQKLWLLIYAQTIYAVINKSRSACVDHGNSYYLLKKRESALHIPGRPEPDRVPCSVIGVVKK